MRASRVLLALVGGLGFLLLLAPSAGAQSSAGGYRVFRPAGAGPHPGVAFVSGCSGFAPSIAPTFYERVAEHFREQGFMVIFVDYLGRRGLQSCARAPITHADAARDLVSAVAWLKSQPDMDQGRIAAMGWSYGGGAILVALAEHTEDQLGFSRAVVYYPDCRAVKPWKPATPVLMLLAGEDDVAPGKKCQTTVKENAAPETVKIVIYPDAYHAFDVSGLPAKAQYPFGTIGYHPQAAAAAWEEIQRFLEPLK